MLPGSLDRFRKRLLLVLIVAPVFFGCQMTPNVYTRKAGRPWNYYGNLESVSRDQTGGTQVALVWLDQVQFQRVNVSDFQKSVQTYLHQGYRKIGFVSVRSQYFVDPYEITKLAADKGARLVVGCWFAPRERRSETSTVDYWYQLLDKAGTAPLPAAVPQAPVLTTPTPPYHNDYY
jgi:hypothetical protein